MSTGMDYRAAALDDLHESGEATGVDEFSLADHYVKSAQGFGWEHGEALAEARRAARA